MIATIAEMILLLLTIIVFIGLVCFCMYKWMKIIPRRVDRVLESPAYEKARKAKNSTTDTCDYIVIEQEEE